MIQISFCLLFVCLFKLKKTGFPLKLKLLKQKNFIMKVVPDKIRWLTSVIPTLWRLRQKDCLEFEVRLNDKSETLLQNQREITK